MPTILASVLFIENYRNQIPHYTAGISVSKLIRSVVPVILTFPHTGVVGLTTDR